MTTTLKLKNIFLQIAICSTLLACTNKIPVNHYVVKKTNVEKTVSTINSGTIEALKEADLSFGTIGRIYKTQGSLGKKVATNEVLAELENDDLKAVYQESSKELERANEFFKNGLISRSALESAQKAKEIARINLEKTIIRAPFTGLISAFELKVGEFYQTSRTDLKPSVKLIDMDKRLVKGEIDEVDLYLVKPGQLARIKIPAMERRIFSAKVLKVVPFVSTAKDQDRTSQIILEITDDKELLPVGASADVEIIVDKKIDTLAIPTTAIQGSKKERFVYLINEDNKTLKKDVAVGLANYEKSEITSGLQIGDQVLMPGEKYDMSENLKVKITQ